MKQFIIDSVNTYNDFMALYKAFKEGYEVYTIGRDDQLYSWTAEELEESYRQYHNRKYKVYKQVGIAG